MVGTVDRKRRLAREVVRDRGWLPETVSVWVVVAASRTNRARVAAHRAMLRAAFPLDGRRIRAWLDDPVEAVSALSLWPAEVGSRGLTTIRRVRAPRTPARPADAPHGPRPRGLTRDHPARPPPLPSST